MFGRKQEEPEEKKLSPEQEQAADNLRNLGRKAQEIAEKYVKAQFAGEDYEPPTNWTIDKETESWRGVDGSIRSFTTYLVTAPAGIAVFSFSPSELMHLAG